MRRISFHIDEQLDEAVAVHAARAGISKAALIRSFIADRVEPVEPRSDDPWDAMTGWLDDDPVDDIDAVLYEPGGPAPRARR
jgi:hypothetical protein